MQGHETVLCIQDGTRLNFTRRGQTQGRHRLEPDRGGGARPGVAHDPGRQSRRGGVGRAAGRLRRAAPPNPEAEGEPTPKPREERKSFRWIEGLRDCAQAAEQLSETRGVMDREADFLDLFVEHRAAAQQVDLLVRAKADRVLGREKTSDGQTVSRRLFDTVRNAPARGAAKVEVQRLSARVKASKQARKDRREARVADVTLRYQQVALPCPGDEPVAVHVRRTTAAPREWFLRAGEQRRRRHAHPAMVRPGWRIEEYFRVARKVEELQHHTAERSSAPWPKMVIGWRIQLMVQLGREVDLPADLLFSDGELRVLDQQAAAAGAPPGAASDADPPAAHN